MKKQDASTYCFQFSGDSINLSNLTEGNLKTTQSIEIENNERNNINSNSIKAIEEDDNSESNVKAFKREQRAHCGWDETLKGPTSNIKISNGEDGTLNVGYVCCYCVDQ